MRRAHGGTATGFLDFSVSLNPLGPPDSLDFTRRFVRECREDLVQGLQSLDGVTVFPPAANYVFFRVPQAGDVARRLRQQGIVVRQCDHFTGLAADRYLRVAVRKRSENQRLLEALHTAR